MAEELTAPGRGIVRPCEACDRTGRDGGRACRSCEGTTYAVWRACPRCGSLDWRYVNGRHEWDGMHCHSCQASWAMDYPGWTIQVVPPELLTKAG